MKEYDKMISSQVTKYVREVDIIEEKALVYLQIEESVYDRSENLYDTSSEAIAMIQTEYERELCETWSKALPNKQLTRQIAIEGLAIDLMNIVKLPPVLTKSLETSIGVYLNDYYMVFDAAMEDHDIQLVQLKKAIRDYKLASEDPQIKWLLELKKGMQSRFYVEAYASKKETEKALTKVQHKDIKTVLAKAKLHPKLVKNQDVLIFFDFLSLTAVIV